MRRLGQRLLLVGLASLLLAEGTVRVLLAVQGVPQSPHAFEERLRGLLGMFGDNLLARLGDGRTPREPEVRFPHPFHTWDTNNGLAELERLLLEPREAGAYEIWVVGGSVADLFASSDGAKRLVELLGADPRLAGRPVRVRNAARGEFKQPQQVMVVGYYLSLGLAPDALINLDGFNEAAIGTSNAENGSHPAFPSFGAWGALYGARTGDPEREAMRERLTTLRRRAQSATDRLLAFGLHHSALAGTAGVYYVQRCRTLFAQGMAEHLKALKSRRTEPGLRGPRLGGIGQDDPGADDVEAAAHAIEVNWEQSSRTLAAIAAARGIAYLHVLQPTLVEGSKPPSEDEQGLTGLQKSWTEGVQRMYPRLRLAGQRLRASGIAFEDASDVFRDHPETLYFDPIHFGNEGNALLAERVAAALLASLPPE